MNRFNKFIKVVEKAEGGYVNDPADRGAETYKGISRKFHPNWPGWGVVDKHKPLKTNQFINDPELDKCVEDFYETSF
jgi:lysozyme family protein